MKKLNIHVRALIGTVLFLVAMAAISGFTILLIETFGFKIFVGVFFAWCLYMLYEIQLTYLSQKEKLDEMLEKRSETFGQTSVGNDKA